MLRRQLSFLLVPLAGSSLLGACAVPQMAPPKTVQVVMEPVRYFIPNDAGVIEQPWSTNRLVFEGYERGESVKRERLIFNLSSELGVVERRTDNGTAGSGRRYTVRKSITTDRDRTVVTFAAVDSTEYQQGLVLPFPVPAFEAADLRKFLASAHLHVKFEVDSEFSPESTYANLVRLLKSRPYRPGEKDPVSGKIFKQEFIASLRGRDVSLAVETFPYRNGSKAVIYARIPGSETSPNTVDFAVLFEETRVRLAQVLKA